MKKIIVTAALSVALLAGSAQGAALADTVTPVAAPVSTTFAKANHQHKITLKIGKKKVKTVRTRALTVADLLIQKHISLGAHDKVRPALTARVTNGTKVVIKRISLTTVTLTEKYVAVIKEKSKTMRRGLTKVLVAGKPGRSTNTYSVKRVNGKLKSKTLVTRMVLIEPVTRVIRVGTKGPKLNLARLKLWNRIARCESGGNWHINTGNGYYGGLQFAAASWRGAGGRDFASLPHRATKAEQITVANRLYAKMGTRPWGCA
ncbi:MAG TPA: hypothetical protein DCM67_12580 [Propionibacteriaceae bacterium]|nr:hypothetical protein [Propionibacteriaceae bacterium]